MKFLVKFLFLLALLPFGHASAITLNFVCVTFNIAGDCDAGEQQFSVDVMDSSSGSGTLFLFRNDDDDPENIISFGANLGSTKFTLIRHFWQLFQIPM